MNKRFHYYTIYYLALSAGLPHETSFKIAYSSQFIDDNLVELKIAHRGNIIRTFPTQNFGFIDQNLAKRIYVPFHFFPGDSSHSNRKDNKTNPLSTSPNSKGVKKLLVSALQSRNPYRIGIALHTFADSWAHQNFTGIMEQWNSNESAPFIPAIGHAPFVSSPDKWNGYWEDSRLKEPKIHNNSRFLEAAGKIYRYLCLYNNQSFIDQEVVIDILKNTISPPDHKKSKEEITLDFQIKYDIDEYNSQDWINEALDISPEEVSSSFFGKFSKLEWAKENFLHRTSLLPRQTVQALPQFLSTPFYKWHCAAEEQYNSAKRILTPLISLPSYF